MREEDEKRSLSKAMSFYAIKEKPQKEDKKSVWVSALAKVMRVDGSLSYVGVKKDENMNNRIVKDFDAPKAIVQVIEYYPFEWLEEAFMPPVYKSTKKEEIKQYLCSINMKEKEKYDEMSIKELRNELIKMAIKQQSKRNGYEY